jgi:hypothetical protein
MSESHDYGSFLMPNSKLGQKSFKMLDSEKVSIVLLNGNVYIRREGPL